MKVNLMLLKSEKIHNQEQLISILKNQLDKATAELTALVETDSEIASKVAELESLLKQHPDYQSVVSDRFQHTPEPTNSHTKPVAIRIEGDKLDQFTDILESSTTGLDFKRTGDKVIVGVFGKEFFGAYGIKDHEIWMEYRLDSYFKSLGVDFEKILTDTDIEITITDGYTPEETEAYDSVFGHKPPTSAPTQEEKISSNSEQKVEIAPAPTEIPEANEVVASEKVESLPKPESQETDEIFDEFQSESLKERMLSCKNHAELEQLKSENPELVTKVWDDCSILEKNLIKCINAVIDPNPKKRPATPFDRIQWCDPLGQFPTVRYCGFYLHGKQVGENERVIYVHKNNSFKVVDKRSLKAIAEKSQKPCPPELKAKLEAALSTPEVIEEDTAPTAEQISANTFTGLAPTPKPTGTPTGKTPDSTVLEPNDGVKRGDLVRVTTKV